MAKAKNNRPNSIKNEFWTLHSHDTYGIVNLGSFDSKEDALEYASTVVTRYPNGIAVSKSLYLLKPKQAPYELVEYNV